MDLKRFSRSLAGRLTLSAALWALAALLLAGFGLAELNRQTVLRQLDRELDVVIDTLTAGLEPEAGGLALATPPTDPRFTRTFSGRYWQISAVPEAGAAQPILRSRSLWDEALAWPGPARPEQLIARAGDIQHANAIGPNGEEVRVAGVLVRMQGVERPLALFAAADRTATTQDIARFTVTLFATLAALALGLIVAVVVQVRVALKPLTDVQADIASIRKGKRARLDGPYPTEIEPLTAELNSLLEHNREVVERARTHVGNLAHALKTPISVLLNEAREAKGPLADLVGRQAGAMARNVDHYLQRAQAAARAEGIGARAAVEPVLADLARTLEKLYGRDKDIGVEASAPADLFFRGERQDLEEMVGNLMENACKYGGGTVVAAAVRAGDHLLVTVEDDGPGLDAEARVSALKRGARLDETTPGQGLGLSIVDELARMYGGALTLGDSALGGLSAQLKLPASD